MIKCSALIGSIVLLASIGQTAHGQTVSKTWVSSTTGQDTGTCQFVAPCKTFAYAFTQTAAGGELDVKDSGSYGPLTITRAISVVNDGSLAAISVPQGATGITVNAGSQDRVVLQGLTIDGHNVGNDGIDFSAGLSLAIRNCRVRNVTSIGISLQPVGAQLFSVSNTEISNARGYGILVQPFNSSPLSSFSGLDLHDNGTGFFVGYITTMLTSSTIAANGVGLGTEVGATILVGQTAVTGNTTYGIENQGGTVTSYGDNYINGNKTDISGSFGSIARR